MFSGIVEELGEVKKIARRGNISLIEIRAQKALEDVKIGDSIAVNGACLTVVGKDRDSFCFEVMQETLRLTNLGKLRITDKVNLERSLRAGDRVSGHFVSGHIDCLGIIRRKSYLKGNLCFEIAPPVKFLKYCLSKGSIAVDGISLTLVDKKPSVLTVYVIPHTLKNTVLAFRRPSSSVNLEFDRHQSFG